MIHQNPSSPTLALGTWALAGEAPWGYGPCSGAQARETVSAALAAGCGLDTAGLFAGGRVEEQLGQMTVGRDDVTFTTRVGCRMAHGHPQAAFAPENIRADVAAAGERLGRVPDRILLHTPSIAVLRDGQAVAELVKLRDRGRVREVGVSVFDPEEGLIALKQGIDWICIPYNLVNRKAEKRLFPAAVSAGVRIQAREVLHNGMLTEHPRDLSTLTEFDVRREWPAYVLERLTRARERIGRGLPDMTVEQAAIGFALGRSEVSSVVVGCRGAGHVRRNLVNPSPVTGDRRRGLLDALYSPSGGG